MNNHGDFPPVPPLDLIDSALHTYNCWTNETPTVSSVNDSLDRSMMPLIEDHNHSLLVGLPGMTPPQMVSHVAGDGTDMEAMHSFDDIMSPPSSTTNRHGDQDHHQNLPINSIDPIRAATLGMGEYNTASDGGRNDRKISFDHVGCSSSTIQTASAWPDDDGYQKGNYPPAVSTYSKVSRPSSNVASISSTTRTQAVTPALKSNTKTDERDCSSKASSSTMQVQSRTSSSSKETQSLGKDDAWLQKFELLKKYKDDNGNCDVPQKLPLGTWVNKQRMEKKKLDNGEKTSMNQERCRRLESIGFKWAKLKGQTSWNERYEELKAYKEEHGHCIVPTKYKQNSALGRWITSQRSHKKEGSISKANEEKLDKIGFVWDRYHKNESHDI